MKYLLQSGSRLVIKPTKMLKGGIMGTLFASIAAPVTLNKLLGGGLGNRKSGRGLRKRTPNIMEPYVPPTKLVVKEKRTGRGLLIGGSVPYYWPIFYNTSI